MNYGINPIFLFVPIASARQAFSYLAQLDGMSKLVSLWLSEVNNRDSWSGDEQPEDSSIHLVAALHGTLKRLSVGGPCDYITVEDFYNILQHESGTIWRETLFQLYASEMSLKDVAKLCKSLREITLKILEDANLLGYYQLWVIVIIFDWVLEQVHDIWEDYHNRHTSNLAIQSSDIQVLRAIAETARSPIDLNPVLQSIVERVRESGLWPMCAIGIIDPNDQAISVPAHAGFAETYPSNIKFPVSGSATFETIYQRKPIAVRDVYADHDFPVLPDAARAAGYRAILLIPLFIAEMRAVVAFCNKEPHEFRESEITLANAIAQQVMIAIENAQQHQREKQRVDELESLNRLIADQYKLLQRSVATHTALTQLVLDEAGLEGILGAVREILGNPVAVENERFQLLLFSEDWEHFDRHRLESIAAGGTTPALFENPEIASVLDGLHQERRALLVPIIPALGIDRRRVVAPIVAGTEMLGYVWVMEAVHAFDERQDLITTEQAALVFALEMMKQRASYETELRLKADFLGDLFSEIATTQQSDMLRRANFLGFNFNKPAILLIVDNVQNTGAKEADLMNVQHHNRHTIAKIQHAVTSFVEENLVANQSGRIVIIVPASVNGSDSSQTVLELDSIIRSAIQRIDCEANIIIGVGNVFQDINGVRHSFIEATRALDAAKSLRKVNATVRLSDLGIYGVLYRKGDSDELLKFARISLLPLIEYDRENGTELLETLNVYLKHQSQLARTARKLYIHVNTLRQRLQRIERVLDIELDNHNVILNLQLALRVYEIAPEIYTSN